MDRDEWTGSAATLRGVMNRGASRILLASDLDGTLLHPGGMLSPATIDAVNGYVSGGGLFTYATARSYLSASRVTAGLDLRQLLATYHGAVIVEPATGRPRSAATLPEPMVRAALALASADPAVQPILYLTLDGADRVLWIAEGSIPLVEAYMAQRAGDPRLLPQRDWSRAPLDAVFEVSLVGDRANLESLRAAVPADAPCHHVLSEDAYLPGAWLLEFTAEGGTKGAALGALKQELGADQLVCFGDNHNDLPMFAIADHAVAVANAAPEVLAAADEVTEANHADGVARWIRRNL